MAGARQATHPVFTQRGINEMAAAVEAARRGLLDDAGLRKPGEAVTPYLRRIARPLLTESRANYLARINGYLALLEQSGRRRKPRAPCLPCAMEARLTSPSGNAL